MPERKAGTLLGIASLALLGFYLVVRLAFMQEIDAALEPVDIEPADAMGASVAADGTMAVPDPRSVPRPEDLHGVPRPGRLHRRRGRA